jgi:hypothetical protein
MGISGDYNVNLNGTNESSSDGITLLQTDIDVDNP